MTTFRRGLRFWVAAWLLCQVASLSALVPRECCERHRPATAEDKPDCHEEPAATHCALRSAPGTACPMHAASESGSEPLADPCSMRRACDGPLIALGALMPNHGVVADPFVMPPDLQAGDVAVRARDNPISSFRSPDPPPPRA
jgi:hypothetical protein